MIRDGASDDCFVVINRTGLLSALGRMGEVNAPFSTRVAASLADRPVWPVRSGRSMSQGPLRLWSGRSRTTRLEKFNGRPGRGDREEVARRELSRFASDLTVTTGRYGAAHCCRYTPTCQVKLIVSIGLRTAPPPSFSKCV